MNEVGNLEIIYNDKDLLVFEKSLMRHVEKSLHKGFLLNKNSFILVANIIYCYFEFLVQNKNIKIMPKIIKNMEEYKITLCKPD